MKRLIAAVLVVISIFSVIGVIASASFGYGAAVIAEDAKIIKSGLYGRKLTFSDTDFKQGLCITDFKKIKITKLPSSNEGTLMLAGRRLTEGTEIKRKNIPALVFIPASKEVSESKFLFTIDDYADGNEIEFLMRFTDKVNYEPEVTEQTGHSSVSTQRDIAIHGKMFASDKEGDALEFMVVSFPKAGSLTVISKETGEYLYTPPSEFVGEEYFSYVVRDEWGNFSKVSTVTLTVSERMSEVEYTDMKDNPHYNAAVAMTGMGIMDGKIIGDGVYFSPEETVTRAEFVSFAMKSLGIRPDSTLTKSFFDDDEDIPLPIMPYVATAARAGIINGSFVQGKLVYNPNSPITKYEAASIMSKLLGKNAEGEMPVFSDISSVPAWARSGVYTMYSLGIFENDGDMINASQKITKAECAEYLYRAISV